MTDNAFLPNNEIVRFPIRRNGNRWEVWAVAAGADEFRVADLGRVSERRAMQMREQYSGMYQLGWVHGHNNGRRHPVAGLNR